jgi:hypothetical protein
MESFNCEKGCCNININSYNASKNDLKKDKKRRKAGVFIYDPVETRILLVQSRGNLWGPPKGTLKDLETEINCAIREVKEETGLIINDNDFTRSTCIYNSSMYFYLEKKTCDVYIQNHIPNNDANGITWIKLNCLISCIDKGTIKLNRHCKIIFNRFLNIKF